MKEQLMQKRAVAIGYFADASRPWDTGGEGHYMSAETWAAYTYEYGGFYMEYLQVRHRRAYHTRRSARTSSS